MKPALLIASPQMRDPFFERAVVLAPEIKRAWTPTSPAGVEKGNWGDDDAPSALPAGGRPGGDRADGPAHAGPAQAHAQGDGHLKGVERERWGARAGEGLRRARAAPG